MPCNSGNDGFGGGHVVYDKGHDPHYRQAYEQEQRARRALKKDLDRTTDLLCKAGRARYSKTDIPPEVLKWWEEHCKLDRARGEPWDVEPPSNKRGTYEEHRSEVSRRK